VNPTEKWRKKIQPLGGKRGHPIEEGKDTTQR